MVPIEQLHLPKGYVSEHVGPVRFTYPASARDEVRSLEAFQPGAWQRVTRELGARISPALDIRVALNPEQMQQLAPHTALPAYADGLAFPEQGIVLLTLTEPTTFARPDMRSVLTHELSHVALHRAVKGAAVPRWFSEGVAVHQAGERSFTRARTLWEGTLQGRLLPLDLLSGAFPARHGDIDLAYAQSADFVGYMLGGSDERVRFRGLLTQVASGVPFTDAVSNAYHVPLGYMEREWRTALSQRYGKWPALLMGLTFVWAIGAILLVVGYVRARRKHKKTLRRWAVEEQADAERSTAPPPQPVMTQPAATASAASAQSLQTQSSSAQSGHAVAIDDFFDSRRQQSDSGVPTVVHDGQQHTLH